MRKFAGIVVFVATCQASAHTCAEAGVTDVEVRFAQVAAIEGPAAALARSVRTGIMSALASRPEIA